MTFDRRNKKHWLWWVNFVVVLIAIVVCINVNRWSLWFLYPIKQASSKDFLLYLKIWMLVSVVSFEHLKSIFVFLCEHYVSLSFACGFDAKLSFYFTKLCFIKILIIKFYLKEICFVWNPKMGLLLLSYNRLNSCVFLHWIIELKSLELSCVFVFEGGHLFNVFYSWWKWLGVCCILLVMKVVKCSMCYAYEGFLTTYAPCVLWVQTKDV